MRMTEYFACHITRYTIMIKPADSTTFNIEFDVTNVWKYIDSMRGHEILWRITA